ncbi:MAG: alpha/beta hydrolase [Chloroflexi bacterium]|nr:alpha/beta hydrolase [Chloroflexota bacterium]
MTWFHSLPLFVAGPLVVAGIACSLTGALVAFFAAATARAIVCPRRDWQPPPILRPPAGAVPVESVRFPNPYGHQLAGWFLAPQPGRPVAILCHGFRTNRREAQDFLPWLRARGYGALLFDFQAHGESEGNFTTVGLREVDDVLAAVGYVRQRLGESVPLVLIGFSMGAAVAIMAAARCPDVEAVIADSPFASLERAVARSFSLFCRLPPRLFLRPVVWFAERLSGGRMRAVAPIDVVAAIAPRPLLLIQGMNDGIVDPEDGGLLYRKAGEPKVLWQVAGCGHVQGRVLYPAEYARRVGEFLDAIFSPAASPDLHLALRSVN